MWRDIVLSLPKTNFVTLAISIFGILFLDLSRTFLTPQIKKFSSIPPPLELILVKISGNEKNKTCQLSGDIWSSDFDDLRAERVLQCDDSEYDSTRVTHDLGLFLIIS